MRKENWGKVVPFALSARRMRQGAETYSRRGRLIEAVELTRRAAEEEDSAGGWMRLEELLRKAGCYEQAEAILGRVLAGGEVPPAAWLDLAYCQRALMMNESAVDSLLHCIHADVYSAEAETAREWLCEIEPGIMDGQRESFRVPMLIRRGMDAWQAGQKELAIRRLKRAAQMDQHPERLYNTMGLMYMAAQEHDSALKVLARAIRLSPDDPRLACTLCVALYGTGKKRAARGILRQWASQCHRPGAEKAFIAAAQTISAREELADYVTLRLKESPYRIELMHVMACAELEAGSADKAAQWWQRILRLNPADLMARTLLKWTREHPGMAPENTADILAQESAARFEDIQRRMLEGEMPDDRDYLPGSAFRSVMDRHIIHGNGLAQLSAVEMLCQQDSPACRQYLKELLTWPELSAEAKQSMITELARHGENGPLLVRIGPSITSVQTATEEQSLRKPWKLFMWQVIMEARGNANGLVDFAAQVWRKLTPEERQKAVGVQGYYWVKSVVIYYLSMTDREAAIRMVMDWPGSPRRIGRIIRRITALLGDAPLQGAQGGETVLKGEIDDENVH